MSVLTTVHCMTGYHRPIRRDVEWNGEAYVGECRHCGKKITRVGYRQWRQRRLKSV